MSEKASELLTHVKADGDGFEELVWDVLLVRGFRDTDDAALPCTSLDGAATESLPLRLDYYTTSQITYNRVRHPEVVAELTELRAVCERRRQSALYRCPRGCASVDYFLVRDDGKCCAIQASVSPLKDHETGDSMAALAAKFDLSGESLVRYIYITTKPTKHPALAKRNDLAHVRIVSAADWISV